MIVGIVGAGANRFTEQTAVWAKRRILEVFVKDSPTIVVSGPSSKGGIESWAAEEAQKLNIPTEELLPEKDEWPFIKKRNILLVERCTKVVCIVARRAPPRGVHTRNAAHCAHCAKASNLDFRHVQSAGCWALHYAMTNSDKQVQLIIVGV